jgi:hypothetical protein
MDDGAGQCAIPTPEEREALKRQGQRVHRNTVLMTAVLTILVLVPGPEQWGQMISWVTRR